MGFGEVKAIGLITGWKVPNIGISGLLINAIIANLAQPTLSFIYFTVNGLFTAMLATLELHDFVKHRKGLRVSTVPKKEQRGTYFLQVPYRYGIPLMIISILLHWLVSQSIS
ncbi:hypothetical protein M501DRAFT_1000189 [Patellaria atrata CBS 101060]|uniref:Uncharacterized protein n=1 Tax=Patellaria atrata CBS 101060 TaxID=1346257 RepID=A0A9P4S2P5_9PEZI|nr:hypothetical protein M501DRAFT_1000189 [Patellaria atrata CBS 101060]